MLYSFWKTYSFSFFHSAFQVGNIGIDSSKIFSEIFNRFFDFTVSSFSCFIVHFEKSVIWSISTFLTVMLVTWSLCQLNVDVRISILVTTFECLWQLGARCFCKKIVDFGIENGQTVANILKLSPKHFVSNIRHKIDVTYNTICISWKWPFPSS